MLASAAGTETIGEGGGASVVRGDAESDANQRRHFETVSVPTSTML
jgi:hypothetical protein